MPLFPSFRLVTVALGFSKVETLNRYESEDADRSVWLDEEPWKSSVATLLRIVADLLPHYVKHWRPTICIEFA